MNDIKGRTTWSDQRNEKKTIDFKKKRKETKLK